MMFKLVHQIVSRLLIFSGVGLVVACNGEAPILTCHTPCAKANEVRDLFCECYVPDKNPVSWPPTTTTPPSGPSFDWSWEEYDGCSLNRHYYLINRNPRTLIVKVSWRIKGTVERESREYTIAGNTTNRADGIDLGYEEEADSGALCADKDFMIAGWREPQHASVKSSMLALLNESSEKLLQDKKIVLAQIEKSQTSKILLALGPSSNNLDIFSKLAQGPKLEISKNNEITQKFIEVQPKDCVAACDLGDPLRCSMKGFPPDQEKLKQVRDRLRQPVKTDEYSAADIFSIFGLTKTSCNREDIKVVNKSMFNKGEYCSMPSYLRETDKDPKYAIHFPYFVKGKKFEIDSNVSGIAFTSGVGSPLLLFADSDTNTDFGGTVVEVLASNKGVYYQTVSSCIFAGIK